MSEHMGVLVEVWPIAADDQGLWLLSAEPWMAGRVMADNEPHSDVDWALSTHGGDVRSRTAFVHSTSWRVVGPHVLLTYVAVVRLDGAQNVREEWPEALPISERLIELYGPAEAGPATAPPAPRDLDVLFHAVRHLRFLLDYDDAAARVLQFEGLAHHLMKLSPALAGMYRDGATNGIPVS